LQPNCNIFRTLRADLAAALPPAVIRYPVVCCNYLSIQSLSHRPPCSFHPFREQHLPTPSDHSKHPHMKMYRMQDISLAGPFRTFKKLPQHSLEHCKIQLREFFHEWGGLVVTPIQHLSLQQGELREGARMELEHKPPAPSFQRLLACRNFELTQ